MKDIYEAIIEIRNQGGRAALATLVSRKGSTPAPLGAKFLVKADGSTVGTIGGGCPEAEVWEEAKKVIEDGRPKLATFNLTGRAQGEGISDDALICGGTMDVFIEPVIADPTVYIFGAGHVALPLAKMSKIAGFRVVVVDDREMFANEERFPDADEIVVSEFKDSFERFSPDDLSYIVIVTRGHLHDSVVLEWACRTKARYVGMMGSRSKIRKTYSKLRENGVPDELLERVNSPIGLDISSETPAEIAVSILAEMIQIRRGGKGAPQDAGQ